MFANLRLRAISSPFDRHCGKEAAMSEDESPQEGNNGEAEIYSAEMLLSIYIRIIDSLIIVWNAAGFKSIH